MTPDITPDLPLLYRAGQAVAAIRQAPKDVMQGAANIGAQVPGTIDRGVKNLQAGQAAISGALNTGIENINAGVEGRAPVGMSLPVLQPSQPIVPTPVVPAPAASATPVTQPTSVSPAIPAPTPVQSNASSATTAANAALSQKFVQGNGEGYFRASEGAFPAIPVTANPGAAAINTGIQQQTTYRDQVINKMHDWIQHGGSADNKSLRAAHALGAVGGAFGGNNFATLQEQGVTAANREAAETARRAAEVAQQRFQTVEQAKSARRNVVSVQTGTVPNPAGPAFAPLPTFKVFGTPDSGMVDITAPGAIQNAAPTHPEGTRGTQPGPNGTLIRGTIHQGKFVPD